MNLGEHRPQRNAFVTWWSIQVSVFFIPLILITLIITAYQPLTLIATTLLAIIYALLLVNRRAQFKKTKYVFFKERIVVYSGGLLSNKESELVLKNITHVKLIRPWIENKIYKTGNVAIHSAGSSGAEASLISVANSEKFYEYIEELLEKRGFTLSDTVIREEEPAKIGIVLNIIGTFGLIGFFALFFGVPTLIAGLIINPVLATIAVIGILIVGSLFGFGVWVSYQDLRRRKYYLCKGVVRYKEGFLTRRDAFIPVQNITDATQTQGIIDRILKLYSVSISCQGAGQEVAFLYMRNGEELAQEIDTQLSQRKDLPSTTISQDSKKTKPSYDKEFTAEYKPSLLRAAIPSLLLLPFIIIAGIIGFFFPASFAIIAQVLFFGAIALGTVIFNAAITSFSVGKESIRQKTEFISKKTQEFTLDKVTGVVYKESPFDRWLNTGTALFWSIGSSSSINFFHVKNLKGTLPKLLAKTGIQKEDVTEEIRVAFNPFAMIFANLFLFALFILVTIALGIFEPIITSIPIVLLLLVVFLRAWSYSKYKLQLHKSHLMFTKGIFWKEYYYVRYDDIKDIESVRYPVINKGTLHVNVAGEQVVKTDKNQSIVSNGFSIPYLKDVQEVHNHFDNILGSNNKIIIEDKETLANSIPGIIFFLLVLTIGSIAAFKIFHIPYVQVIIPMLSLLVAMLTIVAITKVRYEVQEGRVVKKSGIFYKKMKSIDFSRINYVGKSQGAFNKLFKNGNISIHTTGSTSDAQPEITLKNSKKYIDLYQVIKYE